MAELKPQTVTRMGHIDEMLKAKPMNLDEIFEALQLVEPKITDGALRATLVVMSPDDRKMAYILKWEKFAYGCDKKGANWRAIYARGSEKSAPKPRSNTRKARASAHENTVVIATISGMKSTWQ